jgi:hypothetical protein
MKPNHAKFGEEININVSIWTCLAPHINILCWAPSNKTLANRSKDFENSLPTDSTFCYKQAADITPYGIMAYSSVTFRRNEWTVLPGPIDGVCGPGHGWMRRPDTSDL